MQRTVYIYICIYTNTLRRSARIIEKGEYLIVMILYRQIAVYNNNSAAELLYILS